MLTAERTDRRFIDLRGAHRGGAAAIVSLLQGAPLPPLEVQLVDKTPGRAGELGACVRRYHHQATPCTADARSVPVRPNTHLLGLCMDDPSAQLYLLEWASAQLIVIGQMLASRDAASLGGRVLGFGAVIPTGDPGIRKASIELFRRIKALSGGQRASSREVTSPLLNTPQADLTRRALYGDLALGARELLFGDDAGAGGRLMLATALPTPSTYLLEVRYRGGLTRSAMQEQVRSSGGRALVFVDPSNLRWMYLVAPQGRRTPLIVELPGSDVEGITRRVEREDAAIRPNPSWAHVFVTD